MSLTPTDEAKLLELIAKCEPGNLPSRVFEAVAKIAVYPAIEFVLLRVREGEIETLLFQRSWDDPVWPGQWHAPGTILRPTDATVEDAKARLIQDELMGMQLSGPHFVGVAMNNYLRGNGLGIEYWLEVSGEPANGQFYNVNQLPNDIVKEQTQLLQRAIQAYKQGSK